jgi:hypothetical protein
MPRTTLSSYYVSFVIFCSPLPSPAIQSALASRITSCAASAVQAGEGSAEKSLCELEFATHHDDWIHVACLCIVA